MDDDDEKMISRYEANEWLQLPDGFLENLARKHKGPRYFKFSSRAVRYRRSELLAWRDQCLITPPCDVRGPPLQSVSLCEGG